MDVEEKMICEMYTLLCSMNAYKENIIICKELFCHFQIFLLFESFICILALMINLKRHCYFLLFESFSHM